jgi:hypothetical protein
LGVEGKFYFPIDERYDPDGDTEDVAADFIGAVLGSLGAGRLKY